MHFIYFLIPVYNKSHIVKRLPKEIIKIGIKKYEVLLWRRNENSWKNSDSLVWSIKGKWKKKGKEKLSTPSSDRRCIKKSTD